MKPIKKHGASKYIVDLYHNILWSKYKANVFSELYKLRNNEIQFRFFQIAETESQRIGLSTADTSYHQYPYKLMFSGAYENINKYKLASYLFVNTLKSDADLVIIPGYYRLEHWVMLLACLLSNKKRIVFSDSTNRDKKHRAFVFFAKKVFLSLSNAAFTYGSRGLEHLLSHGMKYEKILIRCQAAALPAFYDANSIPELRSKSASPPDKPYFLFVGRLSSEKSIEVLLQAFVVVLKQYPAATLNIVGHGHEEQYLKELAKTLGIEINVNFKKGMNLAELAEEYLKATCLILPSRREPWGLVVNESLHFGCPVIVSDNCGCVPDLLDNDEIGTIFEADNISQLASAMIEAPVKFGNLSEITDRCLKKIAEFTPKNAAEQMVIGCKKILQKI